MVAVVAIVAVGLVGHSPPAGAAPNEENLPAQSGPRVGLQVGHLFIDQLPEDQARLRGQTGASAGGYREVDINLAVVQRTAAILEANGVVVDVLPATVPRDYLADAFVAVHCDAPLDGSSGPRGYKLARYRDSLIPERDDALIEAISDHYGRATRLPLDPNVSRAMTGYYAYNARRYETIISRQTPSTIIELGYLTNPIDRALLVGSQEIISRALADGILTFLNLPPALPPTIVPGAAPAPPEETPGPPLVAPAPGIPMPAVVPTGVPVAARLDGVTGAAECASAPPLAGGDSRTC
jgi:N-acetylmuramoyl-L-alanine amidase